MDKLVGFVNTFQSNFENRTTAKLIGMVWRQVLMYGFSIRTDWKEALVFATYLLDGSRWSRTIYSYQKATIIMMTESADAADKAVIDDLLR